MLTDYKISRITRHDNGRVEVLARIYEGDITTEDEFDSNTSLMVPVTRYRRVGMLREVTLDRPGVPDRALDSQIRGLLNAELARDITRTPIKEQRA